MGLAVALREKGLVVQSFKKGPDYIDPSWLTEITGRPCRNLDLYFMDKSSLRAHFDRCCSGADLALIEGAMGLYDGLDLHGSDSTAAVAQAVGAAVLLVVDCTRMTRSAAALVKGFNEFDADTGIAAVILNQVARPRHEDMLRRSIEEYTGIPVIGAVPRQKNLHIADRHLGLVPAGEMERTQEILAGVGRVVDATVDLQALLAIARTTAPLADQQQAVPAPLCGQVRIGVVKDRVFSFYYPENLEALAGAGAELVYIDSLHDQNLPSLDGLYIGGGFPEIYARELEANQSLRDSIRRSLVGGLTAYAECGGLMYLSRRLHYQGQSYEMCGVLPC
jgi:cobyrinic acid a,c-diamide synthase